MSTDNTKPGGAGWVKWAVIGGVAIVFMVLFKAEIGHLLGRTQEVSISSEGIIIKAQTTTTPLGETLVSNISQAQLPSGTGVPGLPVSGGNGMHMYRGNDFVVSYPETGNWWVDQSTMNQVRHMGVLLVIRHNDIVDGFNPNINISVENVGGMSYSEWLEAGNKVFKQIGSTLIKSEVDAQTQGAVRVVISHEGVYQIQRVLIRSGQAYVMTASTMNTGDAALSNEMLSILNSFRLI